MDGTVIQQFHPDSIILKNGLRKYIVNKIKFKKKTIKTRSISYKFLFEVLSIYWQKAESEKHKAVEANDQRKNTLIRFNGFMLWILCFPLRYTETINIFQTQET